MSTKIDRKRERFAQIIEFIGLANIQIFAKATGIPHQTIRNQIKKGKFSDDVLFEISTRGGDITWLLTGEGPMMKGEMEGVDQDVVFVSRRDVHVSAGDGGIVVDERETGREPFSREFWQSHFGKLSEKHMTIVTVDGDSMLPTLMPNQPVMVDLRDGQKPADGLWVIRIDDGLFVKRIQFIEGGRLLVISDNPSFQTREVDRTAEQGTVALVGRVRWAPRMF